MTTATSDFTVERINAAGLDHILEDLLAVYREVYADRLDDPFFSADRYEKRLRGYAASRGFSLVLGRLGGTLIGYALGYTLPSGSRWWSGLQGAVDPEMLTEDGKRTFALNEIMIRSQWRRQGYARRLHDGLLQNRTEQRATLLVLPDNTPAKAAYVSWGWHKIGELQPFSDAPVYDAMLLELSSPS